MYEILRKEKYSEGLQLLPKNFGEDFAEYLTERREESSKEDDLFMENIAKSKKQLENSIALFKELFRVRKKKLLNLVFVATETGLMKRDYENMLTFEREVFDEMVKNFEKFERETGGMIRGKKKKEKYELRMVMFNQDVEQFIDMDGNSVGPFTSGELANLGNKVAEIFVTSGKAGYVDES